MAGTKKVPIQITEEQAEKLWHSEVSTMLSARLQGREGGIPDDIVIPFDLNSDAPTDEQVYVIVVFAKFQISVEHLESLGTLMQRLLKRTSVCT